MSMRTCVVEKMCGLKDMESKLTQLEKHLSRGVEAKEDGTNYVLDTIGFFRDAVGALRVAPLIINNYEEPEYPSSDSSFEISGDETNNAITARLIGAIQSTNRVVHERIVKLLPEYLQYLCGERADRCHDYPDSSDLYLSIQEIVADLRNTGINISLMEIPQNSYAHPDFVKTVIDDLKKKNPALFMPVAA